MTMRAMRTTQRARKTRTGAVHELLKCVPLVRREAVTCVKARPLGRPGKLREQRVMRKMRWSWTEARC